MSASHQEEEINVFAHGKSHLTIELTSPLKMEGPRAELAFEQPTAGTVMLIAYFAQPPYRPRPRAGSGGQVHQLERQV